MKISAGELRARLESEGPTCRGYLVYGQEDALTHQLRDRIIERVGGPDAASEMRIEHLDAAAVAGQPDKLVIAMSSAGFFEGERVVIVDGASDRLAPVVDELLKDPGELNAVLVMTAGYLGPRSRLRKLFESGQELASSAVFSDPPTSRDVRAMLRKSGIDRISGDALDRLTARLSLHDPAMAPRTIELLALYKMNDPDELTDEDLDTCMPGTIAAATDRLLEAVAGRQAQRIGQAYRDLDDSERNPVTLCILAVHMFRRILIAAANSDGPEAGAAQVRPPLFGPRRTRLIRHAHQWGVAGARYALKELSEADLILRGATPAPGDSLIERTFLRIALWKRTA